MEEITIKLTTERGVLTKTIYNPSDDIKTLAFIIYKIGNDINQVKAEPIIHEFIEKFNLN